MNNILELINSLPTIMSYVIYGALFLIIFCFIAFKDRKVKSVDHFFILSVLISFILKNIFECLIWLFKRITTLEVNKDSPFYYISLLLFTILLSYLFGIIINQKWFNDFLMHIGIERTTNGNIWNDVIQSYTWVCVHVKDEKYYYLGEVEFIEEDCIDPKIVLCRYQFIDKNTGKVFVDYSYDINRRIILHTDNVDAIEIIYTNTCNEANNLDT